ncbi:TetR/AcrR family transcriptional regulator [Aminipila butyrica]|uniref:TetR/AcrR family transcriptional regulator n=1 Tax=Aminipila butyrica TaxID=433296 RepID=A0A858C076_9FIRM|nr:TetR/AcrR family transcriptional regulator [Aminipila butyrica]QIB70454.1 TetR/AcrR family transcriptional regulator [Aminipila butyrica]
MRPFNEKLAADLLKAGKQEFMTHGFLGANMRNIASAAKVTTGALYRYYSDKEALFIELVDEPARVFADRYRERQMSFAAQPLESQLKRMPEITDRESDWMMAYLYDHFDAFKLIACCSAGTRYAYYIDTLIEIESEAGRQLIARMSEAGFPAQDMDDGLIHILSGTLFNGMFETIQHDMPREKAMEYMNSLRDFYSAGWFKVLGLSGD